MPTATTDNRHGLRATATLGLVLALASVSAVQAGSLRPAAPRRYRATLVAAERVPMATAIDGIVRSYRVVEGTAVKAGDLILDFDDTDAQFELELARCDLADANAVLKQAEQEEAALRQLLASESTRRVEVERAAAQREIAAARAHKAEVRVGRAEWRIGCHRLTAPTPGVLVARRKLPGQGVRAFETACELVDVSHLFAVVQVPVDELADLAIGATATFTAANGGAVAGRCKEVGVEANPGSNTVQVKFELDNAGLGLRPGGTGEVLVEGK